MLKGLKGAAVGKYSAGLYLKNGSNMKSSYTGGLATIGVGLLVATFGVIQMSDILSTDKYNMEVQQRQLQALAFTSYEEDGNYMQGEVLSTYAPCLESSGGCTPMSVKDLVPFLARQVIRVDHSNKMSYWDCTEYHAYFLERKLNTNYTSVLYNFTGVQFDDYSCLYTFPNNSEAFVSQLLGAASLD